MATRATTLQIFRQIKAELDRMLDGPARLTELEGAPRADIVQSDSHVCLLMEVPGVSAEDLEVTVVGNLVTVVGERRRPRAPAGRARFLLVERQWGRFERIIELPPAAINPRKAEATLASGLLRVEFPLTTDTRNRKYQLTIRSLEGEQR